MEIIPVKDLIGCIIFLLIFLLVTYKETNLNTPFSPKTETFRYAFTDSEIQAASAILKLSAQQIMTDYPYQPPFLKNRTSEQKLKSMTVEDIKSKFVNSTGLIMLKRYVVDNFIITTDEKAYHRIKFIYNPYAEFNTQTFSRIYDTGAVMSFINFKKEI